MFPKIGGIPPKWMVYFMENPIFMDDLGVPLFLETPIFPITSRDFSGSWSQGDTVDGSEIPNNHLGCIPNPINNGDFHYQPQLVFAGVQPSTVGIYQYIITHWAVYTNL